MAKSLLLSLKGYIVPLTCPLCPSQRWHLGQLMDRFFCLCSWIRPLMSVSRPMAMWTGMPGKPGRMQGTPYMWKRPGPGMLALTRARPCTFRAQGQLPPVSLCSLAPWHPGVEQEVEAGVGDRMNLGGFDAKEVPLAEQKEPSRSPPTLCQPITAFTSCFSLMASLQASPYSDSQPLCQA